MHDPSIPEPLPEFSGAIRGLRDSIRPHVATLGWLDYDAGAGTHNANLPSDLFLITLRCGDTPARRAALGPELEVMLTPMREDARDYRVEGRSQIVVASLTALGMLSIFRTNLHGLADQRLPLSHLCGRARERELWAALQRCHGLGESAEVFGHWLEARALEGPALSPTDQRIARTAWEVSHMDLARYDVHALAAQEGVTRRQLERDFRRRLGVSPGAYARVVRFQRAASAVSAGRPMVDAALDNGYADQAHMNRAIKHYTGLTPRMLAAQGARPGRELLRSGLAGRVFMLDLPPTWAVATAQNETFTPALTNRPTAPLWSSGLYEVAP